MPAGATCRAEQELLASAVSALGEIALGQAQSGMKHDIC